MIFILVAALLIGLSLGLLGSGGAILTLPMLVYGLDMPEKMAIASSLLIVGSISLLSSIPNVLAKRIDWKLVGLFALPSMFGTYLGALLGGISSEQLQMLLFAILMLVAGVKLLNQNSKIIADNDSKHITSQKNNVIIISLLSLGIGILTGFVGVGGGFLLVPAIIIFTRLELKQAVATSLVLITLNSYVGFIKYLLLFENQTVSFQWLTIISFIIIGTIGSIFGQALSNKIKQNKIQIGFAYLLFCLSIFTLYQVISF